jgi:DNA-directed RNA polymerase beta subunit
MRVCLITSNVQNSLRKCFELAWYNREKDCLVSHGTSRFLNEKFFSHSDGFTNHICRCGRQAVVNKERGIYKCVYCRDNSEVAAIPTSWSSNLFMNELNSMNIGVKQILTPYVYEKMAD